jgi:hypothetical protein
MNNQSLNLQKANVWGSKTRKLITRIATHLIGGSPDKPLLELYHYGLTPIVSLSATSYNHRYIETPLSLLNGKTVQWQMDLRAKSETVSAIFLKLGTGLRTNHCQCVLFSKNHKIGSN